MGKALTYWLVGLGAILLLALLILRTVPIPDDISECQVETGTIEAIVEAGQSDAVFLLEENNHRFFINRGLVNGLTLEVLQRDLLGKEVTLYYPKYWTPLDPSQHTKHLSQLNLGDKVYWTEISN